MFVLKRLISLNVETAILISAVIKRRRKHNTTINQPFVCVWISIVYYSAKAPHIWGSLYNDRCSHAEGRSPRLVRISQSINERIFRLCPLSVVSLVTVIAYKIKYKTVELLDHCRGFASGFRRFLVSRVDCRQQRFHQRVGGR